MDTEKNYLLTRKDIVESITNQSDRILDNGFPFLTWFHHDGAFGTKFNIPMVFL